MKNLHWKWASSFFIACTALLSLTGCKDKDEASKLSVDTAEITFSAAGESKTFRISSNTDWVITGYPGWVAVSPSSSSENKTVVISASENTTTTERSCQLIISTEDGKLVENVAVKQQAKESALSVDVAQLTLDGHVNSVASFRITCNGEWSISGAASWLSLSSNNGNGNAQINVYAKSDNSASTARECTLTLTSGKATATITVSQNGLLSSNCNVKPATVVTLADGMAFDCQSDRDVVYYYVTAFTPSVIERLTEAEIIENMSEDIDDRVTPGDQIIVSWKNLSPNTDYIICTVGFDRNGNHGDLAKTKVRTKSGTNQALAPISEVQYNSDNWFWTTGVNGFVTRYYQWFVTRTDLYYSTDAAVAWFFQDAMKRNPDDSPPIVQGDNWIRPRNGGSIFHVVTWAVDINGEFSGRIDRFAGQVDESESPAARAPKKMERELTPKSQNPIRFINR